MKKLFLYLPVLLLAGFSVSNNTITQKERQFATDHLKETREVFIKSVEGLSAAQLSFKADSSRWSVGDCVKHLAISEMGLSKTVHDGLAQAPNPEKRSEIKATDEQLLKGVQDRSAKFQAPEPFQPKNTPFKSVDEALNSFKENRGKIIAFMDSTQADMRNHVTNFPLGAMDAYQVVLLISAHTNRHTQQIKEVMAHPNFPK